MTRFLIRSVLRPVYVGVRQFQYAFQRRLFTALVRATAARCGRDLTIGHYSRVNRQTQLGNNVNMNGLFVLGNGEVRIGDNFHCGPDCLLISSTHDFDHGPAIPYGPETLPLEIVIEDNVWLGARVTILGGTRIGEGAIIQAASCVVGDIPPGAIAGGHPARPFKSRDMEHYRTLKAQGKFH